MTRQRPTADDLPPLAKFFFHTREFKEFREFRDWAYRTARLSP